MKSFLRNLSAPGEFCLVVLVGFGLMIGSSVYRFGACYVCGNPLPVHFNNATLFGLFIYELVLMSTVLWIGRLRGWSISDFGLQLSWKRTGCGILLYLASTIAYKLAFVCTQAPSPVGTRMVAGELTLPFILLNSLTNPIFEETLEVGYFVRALQGFGLWPAVLASALFRGALHLYQGLNGAVGVFAMGLIFGLAYWRWRQLWPLFIAHALADFIGLIYLSHH